MWWGGWGGAVEACVRRGEEDSSLCTGTGKDDDDAKLLLTHVSLFCPDFFKNQKSSSFFKKGRAPPTATSR